MKVREIPQAVREALYSIYCPHCKVWFQRHTIQDIRMARDIALAEQEETP